MILIEINRSGLTENSAKWDFFRCARASEFRFQYMEFSTGDRVMICFCNRVVCVFLKVRHDSIFHVDHHKGVIRVEIDDKSQSDGLKHIDYILPKETEKRIYPMDRMTNYMIQRWICCKYGIYDFHPPISHKIKDREKWFKSQIQFMKGNELSMCWTNYDLVIKYQ